MTKLTLHFILGISIFLMTTSCQHQEKKEIKTSASNYLQALLNDDFATAIHFADDETRNFIAFLAKLDEYSGQQSKKEKVAPINITNINITNDSLATVSFVAHFADNTRNEDTLNMKKVNHQWVAHHTKEGFSPYTPNNITDLA